MKSHAARTALLAAMLAVAGGLSAVGPKDPQPTPKAAGPRAAASGAPVAVDGLDLRTGMMDTSVARPAPGLAPLCGKSEPVVIQLDGPMDAARQAALRASGIVVGDYLPTNAFIVRLDRADAAQVGKLSFVRWFSPYQAAWKLDPELGKRAFNTPERRELAAAGRSMVAVVLFDGLAAEPAVQAIGKIAGATVHRHEEIAGNVEIAVTMNTADLPLLAAMAEVQFVEDAPDITLRNSTDRWIVQSNVAASTPFYDNGIRGEGQIAGILDSALDSNHCSFKDTVNPIGPLHRKILAYNTTLGSSSHGTHVCGTVCGDNGDNTDTRGVAYAGRLVYGPIPSFTETTVLNALTTHHNQGARVHTNSWGDDGTTAYTGMCRGFDAFQYNNEDSFVCLAVSNGSVVTTPENAKNLLAVGASQDTPNQGNHCSGGTGPTVDQRRKPEIYAPGCGTLSASSGTTCSTVALTGTSMASPAIAGAAMLARQYYTAGYFPAGTAGSGPSITPTAALLKATLLNSAVDMTGPAGYPSNQEGWGRVLLDNALFFPGDTRRTIFTDVRNAQGFSTGGSASQIANVLSSGQPLRITLAWTEPPATAGAAAAAVNNLNLVVTSPTGSIFLGNVFTGGVSSTGGAADPRNNLEQVLIASPAVGPWTVQVDAAAVNSGLQGYAVVISGDVQGAPAGLSINLASAVPSLVAPGSTVTVDATINPGADTLVAGSARLYYRYAAGSFASTPLQNVSGNLYRATIPPCLCGDAPQFYVTAQGLSTGSRTSPVNAPTGVYAFGVGAISTTTVLDERFASGLPAGWTTGGLWHATSSCAVAPACESGPWMAYSQDSTCNYNTGVTNSGSLTSPAISLPTVPGGGTITLSYCNTVQTEGAATWDTHRVFANAAQIDSPPESATAWSTRTVDLTSLAGTGVSFRWEFNTGDATLNDFRGWQVDKVQITASSSACTPNCRVDLDGDGLVTPADIATFVNTWATSLSQDTTLGDFDRDGAVAPADVAAFVSAWFAALTAGTCP